jgi:transcriptional regulator
MQPNPRRQRIRLTRDEVAAIRAAAAAGEQQKRIALRFGTSQANVSLIVRGKRHANL